MPYALSFIPAQAGIQRRCSWICRTAPLSGRRPAFVLLPLLWQVERSTLQIDVAEKAHQPLLMVFARQLQTADNVCDVVDCRTEARPR